MKILLLLLMLPFSMPLFNGDDFAAGVRAYREDRFRDALEAFTKAEKTAGNGASPELLHNRAMAALCAGELIEAEFSAEKAAVRGGPEFAALRDFLLGNTAFARCGKAETEAGMLEADPFAFDTAIAHAEIAGRCWQRAASSRSDWPAARRNVERALLKLKALKKKKEAAKQQKKKIKDKKNMNQPDPLLQSQRPKPEDQEQESRVKPLLHELPPELVRRLLDKLNEKEKEKLALRKAQQRLQRAEVEKDW